MPWCRRSGCTLIELIEARVPSTDQIHPTLAPAGDEPVLGKTTIGAFATTNLHELLQTSGVGRVIVVGVATSGTVLSTARWAFDVGYEVTVCADACADPRPAGPCRAARRVGFPEELDRALAHRPGAAFDRDQRVAPVTGKPHRPVPAPFQRAAGSPSLGLATSAASRA